MADFKKISKEEWLKLSKEEQDYLTLQFNKSVEQRRRIGLITTRSIALLCVLALFFMGYVQVGKAGEINRIFDQYGQNAHCYLCGLENMRKCECYYYKTTSAGNFVNTPNFTVIKQELADYNIQTCKSWKDYQNEQMELIKENNITSVGNALDLSSLLKNTQN